MNGFSRLFKRLNSNFVIYFLALTLLLCSKPGYCRDLSHRLGFGFNNEFSNSSATKPIPAISLKYGLTKDLHISPIFGFNTLSPAGITVAAKVYKNIFYESNLNFYSAFGLGFIKDQQSGIELLGVLGAEFFIPGIESLGFLFEAGVSATNVSGSFVLKTIGFTFIQAGMHFYF